MKKLIYVSLIFVLAISVSLLAACDFISPTIKSGKYYLVGSDNSYIDINSKKIYFYSIDFSYVDELNGIDTESNITDVIETISKDGTFYIQYKAPYDNLSLRLKYYKDDKMIVFGQYVYKLKE